MGPCCHRSLQLGTELPGPNGHQLGSERVLRRERGNEVHCQPGPLRTHLNAPEDAMGVYSVLGATEDGCCVVITFISRAVATNTKKGEQDSDWSTGATGNVHLQQEECFLKAHRTTVGCFCFCFASLHWVYFRSEALWAVGCSILLSQPRSPPSHSDSRRHTTPSGSMPLRQAGKSHSGKISSPGSCLPSRWEGWQLWISQEWADASSSHQVQWIFVGTSWLSL